jgi:hypothetical protein
MRNSNVCSGVVRSNGCEWVMERVKGRSRRTESRHAIWKGREGMANFLRSATPLDLMARATAPALILCSDGVVPSPRRRVGMTRRPAARRAAAFLKQGWSLFPIAIRLARRSGCSADFQSAVSPTSSRQAPRRHDIRSLFT